MIAATVAATVLNDLLDFEMKLQHLVLDMGARLLVGAGCLGHVTPLVFLLCIFRVHERIIEYKHFLLEF